MPKQQPKKSSEDPEKSEETEKKKSKFKVKVVKQNVAEEFIGVINLKLIFIIIQNYL